MLNFSPDIFVDASLSVIEWNVPLFMTAKVHNIQYQ